MKGFYNYILAVLMICVGLTACQKEPTASFVNPVNALVGSSVTFVNTSENAYSYTWNFGDGTTSTDINPTHSYNTNGSFSVTLKAFSKNGKKSNDATASINVNTVVNPDPSSLEQLSKDDLQFEASDDEIQNDANAVLSTNGDTTISSCAISTDTVGTNLQFTLVYNGFNIGHNFSRTGTVIITKLLAVQWRTTGCAVTYQYVNLAITKISSGKTFVYNGTRTWTNISGGLIDQLGTLSSINPVVQQVTGAIEITFDDGTQRTWNIARQKSWSGTYPSALTVTVSGFGSSAGYTNLIVYGTNRNGEVFYAQINTPILYNESCFDYQWTPIWGALVYQIPATPKSATVTFGYNSNDVLVTEGACAVYYQMAWTWKSYSGTDYFPIP
jgi:PKD repeat protein